MIPFCLPGGTNFLFLFSIPFSIFEKERARSVWACFGTQGLPAARFLHVRMLMSGENLFLPACKYRRQNPNIRFTRKRACIWRGSGSAKSGGKTRTRSFLRKH